MDFRFLLIRRRKLLSVGYDLDLQELHSACYDLLATNAAPPSSPPSPRKISRRKAGFMLGRAHTLDKGRPVLLSWTGTMFEYLMPAIWMRTYANTLLDRSCAAVVKSQQAYTAAKRIPGGFPNPRTSKPTPPGNYQYHAFGIPSSACATKIEQAGHLSLLDFLAMHVDAPRRRRELPPNDPRRMVRPLRLLRIRPTTAPAKRLDGPRCEIVRCWMAHHQGMILLSIANFLHDGVVQNWFHSDPRVQATELLLHEKPVSHVEKSHRPRATAA